MIDKKMKKHRLKTEITAFCTKIMETQPWKEFSLPQDVGLRNKLEEKKKEYFARMGTPDSQTGWSCWEQCDLTRRHDVDPGFRLLYYKLIVLSDILMACDKHTELQRRTGHNGLPDTIESRMIRFGIAESLNRQVDSVAFEAACKVIHDYIVGNRQLN